MISWREVDVSVIVSNYLFKLIAPSLIQTVVLFTIIQSNQRPVDRNAIPPGGRKPGHAVDCDYL